MAGSMSDFAIARQNMVDCQVRPSDVTDIRVIDAMLSVPREAFLPASQRALAYLDIDLAVGGEAARRFLIQPAVIARLLQAAEIKSSDRVLVVGCASGYLAAVVALLARDVVATESDPALASQAAATLSDLGHLNVTVITTAAAEGGAAAAPYDVIVLDGASEVTLTGLYQQLSPEGCLVGVFGISRPSRAMLVRRSQEDFGSRALFDATVPVLPGLERLPEFVF